jgi:6-pyruvoyl-tetrahydropterin synthase
MKMLAVVQTRFTALHCWPDAPLAVEYLRHPHRHEFHVTVKVEQKHDDRDVEFLMLKQQVEKIAKAWHGADMAHASCEWMAHKIAALLQDKDLPVTFVSVFEDGENGAEITF